MLRPTRRVPLSGMWFDSSCRVWRNIFDIFFRRCLRRVLNAAFCPQNTVFVQVFCWLGGFTYTLFFERSDERHAQQGAPSLKPVGTDPKTGLLAGIPTARYVLTL